MTDPAATRLADDPKRSTLLVGTATIIVALVDTIARHFDHYRDKDVPPLKDVTPGDPAKLTRFPTLAVIAESGDRMESGCEHASGNELIVLRLYLEKVEKTQGDNAELIVARYLDTIRAILYEHRTLEDEDGRSRVFKAWPARHVIGTFVQEDRTTGKQSRVRGGVLEVEVTTAERIANRQQRGG
jgi:hypothetical protein